MHNAQLYEEIGSMVDRGLTEVKNKGELDAQNLDYLFKLMTSKHYLDKCMDKEMGGQSYGQSYANRRSYGQSYDMMMPMESYGMSMGRDSDGRFSRDNFRDPSFRRGSYGQSYEYSRDNAPLMQRLETMMNEARNDSERQAIKDFVNRM